MGSEHEDTGALEAPWWVKGGGGALALTGVFGVMLGAQTMLSSSVSPVALFGTQHPMLSLTVLGNIGLGIGAIAASVAVMQAKARGAIAGLVLAVLLGIIMALPFFMGMISCAAVLGGGLAFISVILMALSIPACLVVTRNRQKLLDV